MPSHHSYCMTCKTKTPNVGGKVVSSRGRKRLVSRCGCGTNKSQFLPSNAFGTIQHGGVRVFH